MTHKRSEKYLKYGIIFFAVIFLFLSILIVIDERKFNNFVLSMRRENLSFNKLKIDNFKCNVVNDFLVIEMDISSISNEKIYQPKMIYYLMDRDKKVLFRGVKVVRPVLDKNDEGTVIIKTPHLDAKYIKFYFVDMDGKPVNCKLIKLE